jgi:protein-L-isoaspartate(D-aspartate) O-methyltransferase
MGPTAPQPERTTERERMIAEQLVARGIRDERVLMAMRRIPRERFVPPGQVANAYADGALSIECQQTISQPYMVARMTELLALEPHHRVLEVGTGSGYQTAVLACLVAHVFTIEWHLKLMTQAARRLGELGFSNLSFRCGDGSLGWAEHAPFDGIIVTAGAPEVPAHLTTQLAPGGRLVVPTGPVVDQTLVRVRRTAAGFRNEEIMKCRFVKLLGAAGWRD